MSEQGVLFSQYDTQLRPGNKWVFDYLSELAIVKNLNPMDVAFINYPNKDAGEKHLYHVDNAGNWIDNDGNRVEFGENGNVSIVPMEEH